MIKVHNEQLHKHYSSPGSIRTIKLITSHMAGMDSSWVKDEKHLTLFDWEVSGKDTIWKTYVNMGGYQ
jgi:hypothetical protein